MKKTIYLPLITLLLACLCSAQQKPNVIFILADDMGIGDLGCYGGRIIPTPHMDALAANGMLLTNHYSGAPVCGPSRSTFISGQHTGHAFLRSNPALVAQDSKFKKLIDPHGRTSDFPVRDSDSSLVMLPEVFQKGGYTTKWIGKWGLGNPGTPGGPNEVGFDESYGMITHKDAHTYHPKKIWSNDQYIENVGNQHLHKLFTANAIDFIERKAESPFFLYLAYQVPHAPHASIDSLQDEPFTAQHNLTGKTEVYAAQIAQLDRSIGQIIEKLKAKGIFENTLLIVTSDNGTPYEEESNSLNSNGEFKGIKRSLYEGGFRAPAVLSWPSQIQAGSTSDYISAFWDYLPTFAELIGQDIPAHTDGVSLMPVIRGEQNIQRPEDKPIYVEFICKGHEGRSIRVGDWKLIQWLKKKNQNTELYNLKDDPSENNDLFSSYAEKAEELMTLLKNEHQFNPHFPLPHVD